MGLVEKQIAFAEMISELVLWINSKEDYACAYGEVERTKEQQNIYVSTGKSKTTNSGHLYNLAADLRIFKKVVLDGKTTYIYLTKSEEYRFAGEHWKSMDSENVWGGDWGWDGNHFQHTLMGTNKQQTKTIKV